MANLGRSWLIWDKKRLIWDDSNVTSFLRNYPILMKFFLFFIILNSFSCILTCNKVKIQCIPTKIIHAKLDEKIS